MTSTPEGIVSLSAGLAARGQSIFIGVDTNGEHLHVGVRDSVLVVGPTGSGKTSAVFVPSIATHPGPVVVTAARGETRDPDIRHIVGPARASIAKSMGGAVQDLALDDTFGFVYPEAWWEVATGCDEWSAAERRAYALAEAGVFASTDNYEFWRDQVASLLAPLLFAARLFEPELTGGDLLRAVQDARVGIDDPDEVSLESVLAALEVHVGTHDAVRQLRMFASSAHDPESRSNTLQMVESVLRVLKRSNSSTSAAFDVDAFVRSSGTLFIVLGDRGARDARSLVATLLGALEEAWNRCPPAERSPSMLFALDEVASVAPVPSLPRTMGTAGGSGIQLLLGMQHSSQATGSHSPWGSLGEGILRGANHMVVFPGLDDEGLLKPLESMVPRVARTHLEVNVVQGFARKPGCADAGRLIRERRAIEELLAGTSAVRHKAELTRLIHRIRADRLRDFVKSPKGSKTGDVYDEVMELTVVKETASLRGEIETADIFAGHEGSVFVRSGRSFRFVKATPAHESPYWTKLLGTDLV